MNLNYWLQLATAKLQKNDIQTARLDALVLLTDCLQHDKAWILSHPEFELTTEINQELDGKLHRRSNHEPLSYIRGKSEFYGREFIVTPDTLQPRSETETMLDCLGIIYKSHFSSLLEDNPPKNVTKNGSRILENIVLIDVGTGSGCIAITAKLEHPSTTVYATDISEAALQIAKKNALYLNADVTFLKGNLLAPLHLPSITYNLSVLLCNLPYVPTNHIINHAAMHEPTIAIFGGEDGLDLYRELFKQISGRSKVKNLKSKAQPLYIFTESLPFQHQVLVTIANEHGYELVQTEDFIQVFISSSKE